MQIKNTMKKYACLLLFALLLNGCDDGDLTVEEFNFEDVDSAHCGDTYELIYKIKNQESLLLQIPDETLKNVVTADGDPQEFDIDNSNYKLVYRAYDGTITSSNICDIIRPSTPNVSNEWYATGGKIYIATKVNTTLNTTDNSTTITGYTHTIYFKNLTFSKSAGIQVQPEFTFGTIITDADELNLDFKEEAEQCTTSKQIYNYSIGNGTSITIDNIDSDLIVNEVTPTGSPRKKLITTTNNKVTYKIYEGGVLSESYFCNTTIPTTPTVAEIWNAENGVDNTSGIIEVVTATLGPNTFTHTITLKNVTLNNGNVSFNLGNSFLLGILTTTTN